MKTMNAVNAVQLFILVWTFTAVCQTDDHFSVSCEDVTGTVRKEVTFTCSLSLKKPECCIPMYKFLYPKTYSDPTICREEFPQHSCEQRNSFTCSFSSTTATTELFRFFIQTSCGSKKIEFTVNITEPSKPEITEAPDLKEQRAENDFGSKNAVIAAVTGCFIFIIFIIIIIMTIIYKKKPNYSKPCGFQRMFLRHKHDDNNINFKEQNPEDVL